MANYTRHPGSFKDPSGFVFELNGKIYRKINRSYALAYDELMDSGLYKDLVNKKFLIPHIEVEDNHTQTDEGYKTILPSQIPVISYPYEWCFDQLKDAALLTLQIVRAALNHGMILKDATPFNIQFFEGRAIHIDTLSFEKYDPAQPWIAYRQFCQHFLFPLYLEHYLKTDLQKIMSSYLDGIPVEVTAKLLPFRSRLNLGVWLHVHTQNSFSKSGKSNHKQVKFSKEKLLNIINHLESIIKGLKSHQSGNWSNYYTESILGQKYLDNKERIFLSFLENLTLTTALDLGANEGHFTKLLSARNIQVIATDNDSKTISNLYSHVIKNKAKNILPLVVDVTNPSPALGFNNAELAAFHTRIKTDLVVALALVHHLAIGKNIPLAMIAAYFNDIAQILIVEFIPKEDPKLQQMLEGRKDIFKEYDITQFERCFKLYFETLRKEKIPGTERVLYLMKRKGDD